MFLSTLPSLGLTTSGSSQHLHSYCSPVVLSWNWVWGSMMRTHILALKVPLESLNPGKLNSSSPSAKVWPMDKPQGQVLHGSLTLTWAWETASESKMKQLSNLDWMELCLQKKWIFQGKISPQTKDGWDLSCDSFLQWPARTTHFILTTLSFELENHIKEVIGWLSLLQLL